jgi:hypothetical protein
MSIVPVSAFFGRNIQPDFAALFFALLATWSFLGWIDGLGARRLFLFSLFAAVTAVVKGTFLILLVPLLFVFPWGRLRERDFRRRLAGQIIWLIPGLVVAIAWVVFTKAVQSGSGSFFPSGRLFLEEAFTWAYWKSKLPIVWRYVGDNFTMPVFFIFLLGLMGSLLDTGSKLSRYIVGSFISAILYFVLISDFAIRHSYYHIPFVPMVCLGAASAVSDGMRIIKGWGGRWVRLRFVLPIILLAVSAPRMKKSVDMHFDKQMIGCDVAGRYIADHAGPGDRIFISYGSPSDPRFEAWRTQYYGILWEAGRRGVLLPSDVERVRFGELERGFRWIVMFRFDWLDVDRRLLDYLHDNYTIRQAGYMVQPEKASEILLYYVLERGGSFDPDRLGTVEKTCARSYDFSSWTIELWVRNVHESPPPERVEGDG